MTTTPRTVSRRKSTCSEPPCPSGTSTSRTWSNPQRVTASTRAMRCRRRRSQRHSQMSNAIRTADRASHAASCSWAGVSDRGTVCTDLACIVCDALKSTFQGGQGRIDVPAEYRPLEEARESRRHRQCLTHERLDDLAKFCRMRGCHEYPDAPYVTHSAPRQARPGFGGHGAVRTPDAPVRPVIGADARPGGLIINAHGEHRTTERLRVGVERAQALEITGVT